MDDRETRYEQEENFLITSLLGDIRADISFLGLTLWDLVWIVVQTVLCGAILSFMPLNIFLKLILGVIGVVFIFLNRFLQFPYRRKRSKRYRKEAKSGTGEKIGEILNVEADGPFYKSGREWQIAFRVKAPPWNEALFSHKKRRIISFAKFLRACMQRHVKVMISTEQSPDFHWDVWNSKRQKNAATHGIQKLKLQRLDYFESLARTQKKETKQTTYYMGLSVNEIRLPRQERDGEEGLEKTQIERRRIIEDLKEIRNLTDILQEGNLLCTTISGFSVTEAVARQWAPLSWNAWKAAQGNWEVDGVNFQTEAIKPQHVTSTTNEKSSRGKMIFTWVRKMIGSSFRWLAGMWSNILAFLKQKKHNRKEKSLVSANVIEERKMILLPENTEENMTISAVNKVRDTEACAESAENRFEKNEHVKRYMENEG
ncbi:hypothetical protein, partial [Brevibacillus sp. SYSU BS000544]|uniref:hypothetical protein n=1 Tax=Brevibacillus sp. SYSU BS000544 TaxID=3416443 RepID=UPI003CE57B50